MKDIDIGANINTRSLVFTNPIAKYITKPTKSQFHKPFQSQFFASLCFQHHQVPQSIFLDDTTMH